MLTLSVGWGGVRSIAGGYPVAVTAPFVVVLVNADRAEGIEDDVVAGLGDAGVDARVEEVTTYADLPDGVRRAVSDGASAVVVAGGDGSLRAAASELVSGKVPLAVIPAGSVNLLAATLGIDGPAAAVRAVASGATRRLDVGRVDGEVFLLGATSGFDAEVVADTPRKRKERFGKLAFVATAVRHLRDAPVAVRVDVDGTERYAGRATSVLALNVGERGGTDFSVLPDTEPDDGELGVAVMRAHGLRGTVRLFWRLARQRPPDRSDMLSFRGRHVVVEWARPVAVQIDGDAADRRARLDVTIEAAALVVCVPE